LLGDSNFFGAGLDDNQILSYFLNDIDRNNKYINLALVNSNINNPASFYLKKWANLPAPKAVIRQILWPNDICASAVIERKAQKTIKDDSNYLLFPFRKVFAEKILLPYYLTMIYEKICQDLTEERFDNYFLSPISNLVKTGTELVIITFDFSKIDKNYETMLKEYIFTGQKIF